MAQAEAIKAYYATLTRQQKIQFLIGMTTFSGQTQIERELEECRKELIRDYFSPKDENGNPDMREMDKRLSAYVYEIAYRTSNFGKAVEAEEKKLPKEVAGEQRNQIAAARAKELSLESFLLQKTSDFLKDRVLKEGLIPDDVMNLMLKTLGKKAATDVEKRDVILAEVDSAMSRLEQRLDKPEHASMRKNYVLGRQALNDGNALMPELKQEYAEFTEEEKAAARDKQREYVLHGLDDMLKTAQLCGQVKLVDDAARLPGIMKRSLFRLSEGGTNKTWWHRNNGEAFSEMMTTLGNYEGALARGDMSEDYIRSAKQTLIDTGLKYLKGKEKVRSSVFGRDRFEAVLTMLASVMDREEFQSLLDRINQKRGLVGKKNNPDYVSAERYYAKVSALTRSMPVSTEAGICLDTLDSYYGPITSGKELENIDISGLKGVSGKGLTGKEFAAAAYAAAMSPEAAMQGKTIPHMSPEDNALATRAEFTTGLAVGKDAGEYLGAVRYSRQKAKEAFDAFESGNREPLGKLLGEALHEMAIQTRCAESVEDTWVYEGEQKNQMLSLLKQDPDLMKSAKEAGLSQEDIKITEAAVEAGKVRGNAMVAREKLKSGREFTAEQKISLYADILLDTYITEEVRGNYYDEPFKNDERQAAVNQAQLQVGGKVFQTVYEMNARRKFMEGAAELKALGEPKSTGTYRQAMKNVIRREGLDKLSLEKAENKFGKLDFQKQTVAKEIGKLKEAPKKAQTMMR